MIIEVLEMLYTTVKMAAAFLFVLGLIVFIHEYGHYIIAKLCGVKITTFSIGFGKEIYGWDDKSGTRWKISAIPLGGYVKMFGDASAASTPDSGLLENMSEEERKGAFHFKPLYQKMLVVAAGPIANFLLSIAIFTYFIMANGIVSVEPVIGKIVADSPAYEAGLEVGDRITKIDGAEIKSFNDISFALSTNLGTPVKTEIKRENQIIELTITPRMFEDEDGLGNKITRPLIGIKSGDFTHTYLNFPQAVGEATVKTYKLCEATLKVIGQMITGKRDANDLKGPIGIAQLSGQAAEKGVNTLLWLMALISANLGLMNLLPVPVLDGGHLVYYTVEAIRGRPLAEKIQEYGFRVGFALITMLMAFTIINDVKKLIF